MSFDIVRELLNTGFWPTFGATQEFTRVFSLEFLYRFLELDLSGAEWMNLHEFLEIEEGL